jgi:methionine--tRNA ligase beta chain
LSIGKFPQPISPPKENCKLEVKDKNMSILEDFKKLEIRIGKVISAEKVPDTDKLIKFVFDFGNERKQVMAGMAEFFNDPSVLVGKEMPVLVNIEQRKLRGYDSQGMIIAADVNGRPILLYPEEEIPPGSIVK